MAEAGTKAMREVSIASALAISIKKDQTPLPLLFYTIDTHQFAGLFEVHPDGVAIQSQRAATAIVYRRLQLVAVNMTAVRSSFPKLEKNVARQMKQTNPTCAVLNGDTDVLNLLGFMIRETKKRRHLPCEAIHDTRKHGREAYRERR